MRSHTSPTLPRSNAGGVLDCGPGGRQARDTRPATSAADPAAAIDALIRRMRDEHNLMPLPLLEILLASGQLPDTLDLAVLKWVQLAPHVLVEGCQLRWNAATKKLMLATDDGGWRVAELGLRWLSSSPPGGWQLVEYKGDFENQRISPELGTILRIVSRAFPSADPVTDPPFEFYQVVDVWGRWQLWDRRRVAHATFLSQAEAIATADQAILDLSDGYTFLDLFDSEDPSGEGELDPPAPGSPAMGDRS